MKNRMEWHCWSENKYGGIGCKTEELRDIVLCWINNWATAGYKHSSLPLFVFSLHSRSLKTAKLHGEGLLQNVSPATIDKMPWDPNGCFIHKNAVASWQSVFEILATPSVGSYFSGSVLRRTKATGECSLPLIFPLSVFLCSSTVSLFSFGTRVAGQGFKKDRRGSRVSRRSKEELERIRLARGGRRISDRNHGKNFYPCTFWTTRSVGEWRYGKKKRYSFMFQDLHLCPRSEWVENTWAHFRIDCHYWPGGNI